MTTAGHSHLCAAYGESPVIALSVQISGGHAELRSDIREIRSDIRGLDDRLRAVEIAFGRVDQRLATLERLHLPTPDPADTDDPLER